MYIERLLPLLDQLHNIGCQRDRAGNRSLHYDQYCLLVLLFFFNPVVRSLRALQQASTLKTVQRKLGVPARHSGHCLRPSRSSVPSDSVASSSPSPPR